MTALQSNLSKHPAEIRHRQNHSCNLAIAFLQLFTNASAGALKNSNEEAITTVNGTYQDVQC